MRRESSLSSTSWENVELSICLYPQHQLTNNPRPFFLLLRINFLPLFLAARQRKLLHHPRTVFGAIFRDLSRISISTIPSKSSDDISRFHRILENYIWEAVLMCLAPCISMCPISSIHWENLINLAVLDLADNLLEVSIPSSLFSLRLLQRIVLSNNHFSGQLPEFSNIFSNLVTYLDLSFNNLEGPILVSIFKFQGLKRLNLSSNKFSAFPFNGPQRLENLTILDIFHNSLLFFYSDTHSSFPLIVAL
ncbi:receptor-like protein 12 [Pyrus ussuriensis x Pyrus communis]|uniref:Receptor-like protein 12 n=1 Tax=Pyrus ussuriensis x Pyrus communis TaxID=2448454 RepID=A0A5N5HVE2_9ROSA|nr:receptor-like protein 12 [Pyrus ussuriensis x Pyrus communis]